MVHTFPIKIFKPGERYEKGTCEEKERTTYLRRVFGFVIAVQKLDMLGYDLF